MPHTPDWHILDNDFPAGNVGLTPPIRRVAAGGAGLTIDGFDRADPPGYVAGGVPRDAFNGNVFRLSASPCMPEIAVTCTVRGCDLTATPILWRLVCRHVLCRHTNVGSFRYRGASETFEREWRGESRTASFTLFGPDCTYSYNDASRVLGGHALLSVSVRRPEATLCDYVHLRIGGTNPAQADVFRYLDAQLAGCDANIVHMVRAIFQHESACTQFAAGAQSAAAMTFKKGHHPEAGQPDCRVRFDWPDDPRHFPLASFDFGVGISQFTRVAGQHVGAEIAWDWRENVRRATNLFLEKLRRKLQPGITWKHLALASWAAYNGRGPAADAYAQRLAMSDEGALVTLTSAAPPQIARIEPARPLDPPGPFLA